jgi:CheY-like chemotaxis protein
MKPARSGELFEPPGALAVETLGGSDAIPTSTTSSQARTERLREFEILSDSPAAPAPLRAAGQEKRKPKAVRTAQPIQRILVADDSPAVRASLTRALEEAGYEVVLASSVQEVTARFTQGNIALVLLDPGMEDKRGWNAFEQMVDLKQDQAFILMIDPLGEVEVRNTSHLAQVVEKPLHMATLLATVRKTLTDPEASRRSALASQQDLARFAKPYLSPHFALESYDHWGLND